MHTACNYKRIKYDVSPRKNAKFSTVLGGFGQRSPPVMIPKQLRQFFKELFFKSFTTYSMKMSGCALDLRLKSLLTYTPALISSLEKQALFFLIN